MTFEPSAHSPSLRDPNGFRERVAAALRKIEETDTLGCPLCGQEVEMYVRGEATRPSEHHDPKCELAALLREAEGG